MFVVVVPASDSDAGASKLFVADVEAEPGCEGGGGEESEELGRMTPSRKRSCTETVAGRFGEGVSRLRKRCGTPVFLNNREGNMVV